MAIKLYLGVPGAGKTLMMQDAVRDAVAEGWTCFVVDMADEWSPDDNIRWRGAPPRTFTVETDDVDSEDLFNDCCEMRDEGGWLIRFPYPWESWNVCELAKRIGDCVFCDDEIDLLARPKSWLDNPLRSMVHRGRHLPDIEGTPRIFHIYGAARRPQNLHTDLTELADEVTLFRLQGKNTKKRILDEGWIDESLLLCDREGITSVGECGCGKLVHFPNLEFILWNSTGQIQHGVLAGLGR